MKNKNKETLQKCFFPSFSSTFILSTYTQSAKLVKWTSFDYKQQHFKFPVNSLVSSSNYYTSLPGIHNLEKDQLSCNFSFLLYIFLTQSTATPRENHSELCHLVRDLGKVTSKCVSGGPDRPRQPDRLMSRLINTRQTTPHVAV